MRVFEVDMSSNESVLHHFTDMPDGAFAVGGLIIDKKRTLYGTKQNGGTSSYGMVFELVRRCRREPKIWIDGISEPQPSWSARSASLCPY